MYCIFYCLTGSTTLKVLFIGWNKIGDDGITMISETLQHNNSLTKLNVQRCGLSLRGTDLSNFVSLSNTDLDSCVDIGFPGPSHILTLNIFI